MFADPGSIKESRSYTFTLSFCHESADKIVCYHARTILDLATLNEMVQAKMLVKEERKNFGIFPLFDNNIGKMAATTAIFHIQSSL